MNTILAALVNGILVSAGVAFAVWAALRLMPRNSLNAATRYAIWCAVLLVTICLPISYYRTGRPKPFIASANSMATAPKVQARIRIVPAVRSINTVPPTRPNIPRPHFPLTIPSSAWPSRILAIWFLSAALMMIRLIASAIILERRKARAFEAPPALAARVAHWITTCGGSNRRIQLNISREISVPLVSGPLRASILLPEKLLARLSEQDFEQIGIHEAAHLVRCDDYALAAQRIVQALFALHPVVHWISRRIDLEREIACDDFVIAANNNSQPYAACLARVIELSGGIRATPVAAAAAEDRSHLARRIEMLLDHTRITSTRLFKVRLALALTSVAAMALGAAQIPGFVSFRAAQPDKPPTLMAQINSAPAPPAAPEQPSVPTRKPNPARPAIPATPAAPEQIPIPAQPAVPPAPAAPPAPPAASVLDSPMVRIPVDVRDPLGRFVTGLDRSVFRIEEDGVDQVITQIAVSDDPADLFILIGEELVPDEALHSLLAEKIPINPGDIVHKVVGRFSPQTPVIEAFKTLRSRLDHVSTREAMIIITSSDNPQTLPFELHNSDMPVYVINVTSLNATLSTKFVAQTGGDYVAVRQQREIPDQLAKIIIAIRNMYFLGYTPRNDMRNGGYRNVQVTLTTPRGLPPLTARTPSGYIAPTN